MYAELQRLRQQGKIKACGKRQLCCYTLMVAAGETQWPLKIVLILASCRQERAHDLQFAVVRMHAQLRQEVIQRFACAKPT